MDSTTEVWKAFGANEITHSQAHHLLAIFELTEKRGYARVTDVARYLEITTGSASTNLKSLKHKGLVAEDDNRFVCLSTEGHRLAEAVLARRGILKAFFVDVLGVSVPHDEVDACKTEHLLSSETTAKMEDFTRRSAGE